MNRASLSVGFLISLAIVAIASGGWAVLDTMVHATSGAEFCGRCHTMEPMVVAYRRDVHGGANATGTAADCSGCHLPHDGSISYLIAKVQTGFHDVWAQLTYDLDEIDWQAKRAERDHFVYDSGCLHCHSRLEEATSSNSKAFVAHKPYFLGLVDRTCVSCHDAVGHVDLDAGLRARTPPANEAPR